MRTLGLPVYAENRVPDHARYPYITWTCTVAAQGEKGVLTVCGWFRSEHIECLALADRLAILLPDQPVLLPYEGGFALVTADELYQKTDAADTSVEACCLKASLRCMAHAREVDPC